MCFHVLLYDSECFCMGTTSVQRPRPPHTASVYHLGRSHGVLLYDSVCFYVRLYDSACFYVLLYDSACITLGGATGCAVYFRGVRMNASAAPWSQGK